MSVKPRKESIDDVLAKMAAVHRTYRISHLNLGTFNFPSPQIFETILFDTILKCNLECVYCHNPRFDGSVKEEDFLHFINTQVKAIGNFQFGCAMEPTMDARLTRFIEILSKSHAKPNADFRIQTNGTLLHKQDINAWKDLGVNMMSISIDTLNPKLHQELRGGSNLDQILKNIKIIRKKWSNLRIWIVATVNKKNIGGIKKLIKYAIDSGINGIELRRMYHFPTSKIIQNHKKMSTLTISNGEFTNMAYLVEEKFGGQIEFYINDEVSISNEIKKQVT